MAMAIPSNRDVLTAADEAEVYSLAVPSISSKTRLSLLGSAFLKPFHSPNSWASAILKEGTVLPISGPPSHPSTA